MNNIMIILVGDNVYFTIPFLDHNISISIQFLIGGYWIVPQRTLIEQYISVLEQKRFYTRGS